MNENREAVEQDRGEAESVLSSSLDLAWEEIESGRFMPRRIRGSYRGGSLG
jgi:hypothetical protein